MRLWVVLLAALGVACAVIGTWAGEAPPPGERVMVVGTLVSVERMEATDKPTWAALELRVDEETKSSLAKLGDVVALHCIWASLRGIGLGDQVRATIAQTPSEPASWAVEEIARLGRGEFLNPGEKATVDLGSPDAKVLVKMFAPLGISCHQATVDLLKEMATADPKRLRVQIFDMRQAATREEANRERLTCATVLINNRYQFTIREGDKERKVEFIHKPNAEESTYNSEDVRVVVRQEIARIYGPEKPVEPTRPAA